MSQHESDREDLMREAVALVERVELRCEGFGELVTAGFRHNGALSVFFGQDPVYQFDPESRLRRAFVDGLLYRSQHTTLAQLKRERTADATVLARTDLDESALSGFRDRMIARLRELEQVIASSRFEVIRSLPESGDLVPEFKAALTRILQQGDAWLSPTIRRRA